MKIRILSLMLLPLSLTVMARKPMSMLFKKTIRELDRPEDITAWYNRSMTNAQDMLKKYDVHMDKEGDKPLTEKEQGLFGQFEDAIMQAFDSVPENAKAAAMLLFGAVKSKLEAHSNLLAKRHAFAQRCLENMSCMGRFLAFMYHCNNKENRDRSKIQPVAIHMKSRYHEPFWERIFIIDENAFFKTQDHMIFGGNKYHMSHTKQPMHHKKGMHHKKSDMHTNRKKENKNEQPKKMNHQRPHPKEDEDFFYSN